MTIVEFLAARLDEDERELQKDPPKGLGYANLAARMRREIALRRHTLDRHSSCGTGIGYCDDGGHGLEDDDGRPLGCADLHDLAAVYSDHPDYQKQWAP